MFHYPAWFGWLAIFLAGWLLTSGIRSGVLELEQSRAAQNILPSPTRIEGL